MLNQALTEELAATVDRMPAFPKSVQRILLLAQNVDCTPKELVQVIDKDPVLTVKTLKVVNSAYFKLPKQINSIGHAVVYLGFNATKNLALALAAIGMLPKENAAGFDWHEYLLHSLATAGVAKQLAVRIGGADPMDCFVAGLLHDFGKVALARFMPAQVQRAMDISHGNGSSLHLAMREVVGADHATVGAMLIEKWQFAPSMIDTVRNQFGTDIKDTAMIACVFAANQISKRLEFGNAGNPFVSELPEAVAQRLGGTLEDVIMSLGDLAPMFEEARQLAKV